MGKAKRRKAKKLKKAKQIHRFPRPSFLFIVMIISIIVATAVAYISINPASNPPPESKLKAAIIDSLYIMDPNQDFLTEANQTLSNSGFKVDIYLGEDVTVELFQNLPSLGYKLIVLRVHTAYNPDFVVFFTGTHADSEYFTELLIGWVRIGEVGGQRFYTVTPSLIEEATGYRRFQNSILIVDSCYGLNSTSMARSFIYKGASAYIAWDQGVYPNYSDGATLELINYLLDGMTVEQAVNATTKDPDLGSELSYYGNGYAKLR